MSEILTLPVASVPQSEPERSVYIENYLRSIREDLLKLLIGAEIIVTTRITTTATLTVVANKINNYFCNTDSAGYTVTLPAGTADDYARVINSGSSGNTLTLAPDGAEHLIGVNSNFTLADGEILTICFNSTDGWY
jgi:hypothetical protein